MKSMVDKFIQNEVETVSINTKRIRRDPDHTIITVDVPKVFRAVFTKRCISDDYCSYEYGYWMFVVEIKIEK